MKRIDKPLGLLSLSSHLRMILGWQLLIVLFKSCQSLNKIEHQTSKIVGSFGLGELLHDVHFVKHECRQITKDGCSKHYQHHGVNCELNFGLRREFWFCSPKSETRKTWKGMTHTSTLNSLKDIYIHTKVAVSLFSKHIPWYTTLAWLESGFKHNWQKSFPFGISNWTCFLGETALVSCIASWPAWKKNILRTGYRTRWSIK